MNKMLDDILKVIYQEQVITNLMFVNKELFELGEISRETYIESLYLYQEMVKNGRIFKETSQQNQSL